MRRTLEVWIFDPLNRRSLLITATSDTWTDCLAAVSSPVEASGCSAGELRSMFRYVSKVVSRSEDQDIKQLGITNRTVCLTRSVSSF